MSLRYMALPCSMLSITRQVTSQGPCLLCMSRLQNSQQSNSQVYLKMTRDERRSKVKTNYYKVAYPARNSDNLRKGMGMGCMEPTIILIIQGYHWILVSCKYD